jgi:uncharacterized protein (DUF2384 family)
MSESDSKPTDDLAGTAGLADNQELVLSELKGLVWLEIVELFEGDEAEARNWMTRNRPVLGNVAPEDMLDSRENIDRLRCFIQQIQRGIIP